MRHAKENKGLYPQGNLRALLNELVGSVGPIHLKELEEMIGTTS